MRALFRFLPVFCSSFIAVPASAVIIDVSYEYDTGGFFGDSAQGSAARASMEAAAQFYSDILTDSLSPIRSDVNANNNYEVSFNAPSDRSSVTIPFLQLPSDTIRIYVGSRDLGSTLGLASIGNLSVSGDIGFQQSAINRGQDFGTRSEPRAEIAPWGGTITFNNRTSGVGSFGFWNYDHTSQPSFNNDLYSTALHEIGHILGLGTAGSYYSFIPENTTLFTGPRTMLFNDGQPLLLDGDRIHVGDDELETHPHPYADGDEGQLSAFLATRPIRERRELTLLDTAILDDIGWDVNYLVAIPEPSSAVLSLSAIALLAMRRRRA